MESTISRKEHSSAPLPYIQLSEEHKEKSSDLSDDSVIILGSEFFPTEVSPPVQRNDSEVVEIALPEFVEAKKKLEREEAVWLTSQRNRKKRGCSQSGTHAENRCCSVCYDSKTLYISKCKHVCCKACWKKWLSEHKKCPVCRQRTRIKFLSILE